MRTGLVGFGLGVAVTLGSVAWLTSGASARAAGGLNREAFEQALDRVLNRYVEPVDRGRLMSTGLKHMVAGLDPHSHYLTAAERKRIRARAKGGTTGLHVTLHRGDDPEGRRLEVVGVNPGSPAEQAGLRPGDHVLSVRGTDVAFLLSQVDAEALLLGSPGETLALSVQRRGDPGPRAVALTFARGQGKTVEGTVIRQNGRAFAKIEIHRFAAGTGERVEKELKRLRRAAGASGLAGVLLDLRGNPGGEVDEALVVADLFVGSGLLTRTRGRGGRILREERAHAVGTDTTTPLVVLQDRHSASAAELLAAALRDHGRATIVGEQSYGKGTVQEVMGLQDGSLLTLTVARYFSPKDRVIHGQGVTPDVHVPPTPGGAGTQGDPALQRGLEQL